MWRRGEERISLPLTLADNRKNVLPTPITPTVAPPRLKASVRENPILASAPSGRMLSFS